MRSRSSWLMQVPVAMLLLVPASSHAQQTCPAPMPVTPLGSCHPSMCTQNFCGRGDIAPLSTRPATHALQDRLVLLDCSPHSIAPLQIFAEADPAHEGKSRLFQYYLLDSTSFQPSVFTTTIPGINDDPSTMRTSWGGNCNLSTDRCRAPGAGAEAGIADRTR